MALSCNINCARNAEFRAVLWISLISTVKSLTSIVTSNAKLQRDSPMTRKEVGRPKQYLVTAADGIVQVLSIFTLDTNGDELVGGAVEPGSYDRKLGTLLQSIALTT